MPTVVQEVVPEVVPGVVTEVAPEEEIEIKAPSSREEETIIMVVTTEGPEAANIEIADLVATGRIESLVETDLETGGEATSTEKINSSFCFSA
jgi:hypothetical protein